MRNPVSQSYSDYLILLMLYFLIELSNLMFGFVTLKKINLNIYPQLVNRHHFGDNKMWR
jgi:hypothetical protein